MQNIGETQGATAVNTARAQGSPADEWKATSLTSTNVSASRSRIVVELAWNWSHCKPCGICVGHRYPELRSSQTDGAVQRLARASALGGYASQTSVDASQMLPWARFHQSSVWSPRRCAVDALRLSERHRTTRAPRSFRASRDTLNRSDAYDAIELAIDLEQEFLRSTRPYRYEQNFCNVASEQPSPALTRAEVRGLSGPDGYLGVFGRGRRPRA